MTMMPPGHLHPAIRAPGHPWSQLTPTIDRSNPYTTRTDPRTHTAAVHRPGCPGPPAPGPRPPAMVSTTLRRVAEAAIAVLRTAGFDDTVHGLVHPRLLTRVLPRLRGYVPPPDCTTPPPLVVPPPLFPPLVCATTIR